MSRYQVGTSAYKLEEYDYYSKRSDEKAAGRKVKKNKQNENGFLIALYALRSANGDKIKAVSFLKKLKDTVIAYYDYKINVEKIRTKALSELCNDLINF